MARKQRIGHRTGRGQMPAASKGIKKEKPPRRGHAPDYSTESPEATQLDFVGFSHLREEAARILVEKFALVEVRRTALSGIFMRPVQPPNPVMVFAKSPEPSIIASCTGG